MADEDLIKAAIDARKRAYAPYSKFDVGAAIRDETGRIHRGRISKMPPIPTVSVRRRQPLRR